MNWTVLVIAGLGAGLGWLVVSSWFERRPKERGPDENPLASPEDRAHEP